MDARHYLRWMLWPLGAALVVIVGFNFVVDPLQYFRSSTWYPPQYSSNQRYQNPALARTQDYDTIVLGTSHMENARSSLVQAALGGQVLKLTIAGSTVVEQHLLAQVALRSGRVRRVIWGIDAGSFTIVDRLLDSDGPFPIHLYRGPLFAAGPYLLSWSTTHDAIAALRAPSGTALDSLNAWPDYEFSAPRVHAAWDDMGLRWTPQLRKHWAGAVSSWPQARQALDTQVFALARAYPQTRFDLLFLPYTLLEYANDFRVDDLRFFQRILLAAQTRKLAQGLPNVRVWDFSAQLQISTQLDNYKDLAHFHPRVLAELIKRLDGEPEEVDPRLIAFQLRDYLRVQCAYNAIQRDRWCPPLAACGLTRVSRWLDAGADLQSAADYATASCQSTD